MRNRENNNKILFLFFIIFIFFLHLLKTNLEIFYSEKFSYKMLLIMFGKSIKWKNVLFYLVNTDLKMFDNSNNEFFLTIKIFFVYTSWWIHNETNISCIIETSVCTWKFSYKKLLIMIGKLRQFLLKIGKKMVIRKDYVVSGNFCLNSSYL